MNFKHILQRADFDYIIDENNIDRVVQIVMESLAVQEDTRKLQELIFDYMNQLMSFYFWLNARDVPDITIGFESAREKLAQVHGLLKEDIAKRRSISRNILKGLRDDFLYGISRLYKGLKTVFDPDLVTESNITKEQLVRYFLDEKEGLRGKFSFNKTGKYAFANRLDELTKEELVVSERLLLRPSDGQVRTYHHWTDLGTGRGLVRVLMHDSMFGRKKVFFVYRNSEHPDYEAQLRIPPDKVSFAAA